MSLSHARQLKATRGRQGIFTAHAQRIANVERFHQSTVTDGVKFGSPLITDYHVSGISWDVIAGTFAAFKDAITDVISWAWSEITKTFTDICNTLGSWANMVGILGNVAWSQITKTFTDILNTIASWANAVSILGNLAWSIITKTAADILTTIASWANIVVTLGTITLATFATAFFINLDKFGEYFPYYNLIRPALYAFLGEYIAQDTDSGYNFTTVGTGTITFNKNQFLISTGTTASSQAILSEKTYKFDLGSGSFGRFLAATYIGAALGYVLVRIVNSSGTEAIGYSFTYYSGTYCLCRGFVRTGGTSYYTSSIQLAGAGANLEWHTIGAGVDFYVNGAYIGSVPHVTGSAMGRLEIYAVNLTSAALNQIELVNFEAMVKSW